MNFEYGYNEPVSLPGEDLEDKYLEYERRRKEMAKGTTNIRIDIEINFENLAALEDAEEDEALSDAINDLEDIIKEYLMETLEGVEDVNVWI